jgi:hypothetical protein
MGWFINSRIAIGPRGWLRSTDLRMCRTRSASAPCIWLRHRQGHGIGPSFWLDLRGTRHYFKVRAS